MSLLNDALKAAEQRQQTPAPSPYIGQGGTAPRRSHAGKILLGLGLVSVMAAAAYLYLQTGTEPAPQLAGSEPAQQTPSPATYAAAEETLAAEPATRPTVPEDTAPQASDTPARVAGVSKPADPEASASEAPVVVARTPVQPEPAEGANVSADSATRQQPDTSAEQRQVQVAAAETPEAPAPAVPEPVSAPAPTPTQPQPQVATNPAAAPGVSPTQVTDRPSTASAGSTIKQTRQTPAQQDQDASKKIKALLANGDTGGAESVLSEVTGSQVAPQSRYTFARSILARGDVERALAWAPSDLAARHPDLRLIRARALLAGGDLAAAVATLQSRVPAVADNIEYRVTLATLLQQQGQSDQAASHWAELIAWDNSQAPWWVGLAIALEGRGDVPAARRAYQQAAALPGLAPSLADYVRQRLQILGAG